MTKEKKSNCFSCLLILLIIGFLAVLSPIYYFYTNYNYTSKNAVQIDIQEGDGTDDISRKLATSKVVKSDLFFQIYTFYTNDYQLFQPGSYNIPAGSTIDDTIKILTTIKETEVKLTFPEGMTTDEIFDLVSANTSVSKSELLKESLKQSSNLPFDISNYPINDHLEGFIFPDTYIFNIDTTASEVVEKILDNFNKKWNSLEKNETELSDYDILILASIIEKEAANADESQIISGILHDRLKYNIYLGVNSTINYILNEPEAFFSNGENNIDSPYNTYLNYGLPPTPICNPGLSSIKAALNPEFTDYVFYLHTPDGQIIYSETLDEHNLNIAKYY